MPSGGKVIHGHNHRGRRSAEYRAWANMIQRCVNPKASFFYAYGARGISVCKEWMDFSTFLRDMGVKPSSRHTIERRDNDADYCASNCYWALPIEQSRNRRSTLRVIVDGIDMCLKDVAIKFGLKYDTLRYRITHGWPLKDALRRDNLHTVAFFNRDTAPCRPRYSGGFIGTIETVEGEVK